MKITMKLLGFFALVVIVGLAIVSCPDPVSDPGSPDSGSGNSDPTVPVANDETPVAEDFNIGNLTQIEGNVTAVTITPKAGKSTGKVTIYYNGSTTLPMATGEYTVTFNVAAVAGWKAASGLDAGTLIISDRINARTPSISSQPVGATVTFNTSHSLFVSASISDDGSLSYQWYSNTSASNSGGTPINGATNSSYDPPTGTEGTYYYFVEVTNTIDDNGDGGNKTESVRSNAIILTVNTQVNAQTPVITSQPVGDTKIFNAPHSLSVSANVSDGGSLSYQWYSNTSLSNSDGTPIGGATSADYNPPTSTAGTFFYFVEITNTISDNGDGGNKTAVGRSNAVTLTVNEQVNAQIPSISSQPVGATVIVDAVRSLSVSASISDGGMLSYQWYSNTSAVNSGGTIIGGATASSYNAPTGTVGIYHYYVEITNTISNNGDGGSKTASIKSNAVTLTVNEQVHAQTPSISSQPVGATVSVNALRSLSVAANVSDGGTLSYRWYRNTSLSNSGGTVISDATSSSYNLPTGTAGTFFYFAEITNTITDNGDEGNKTASVRSNAVEVRVQSPSGIVIDLPEINEWELPEQTTLTTANVNKAFTVNGTYTTYRWYLDGTQVGTSSSYTFNKPAGVYQLVVVVTNSAGESRSGRCLISVASPLTADRWTDGTTADASGEEWYSFPVNSGTTYRLWWDDKKQGSNTNKTGDVAIAARYENATTFIFGGTNTTVDSGYTTAQSFTANQTGTVYIRVIPYNRSNSNIGTYSFVYSTSSTRPAIYTVTFYANNGIGTPPAARTVNPGSSIMLPSGDGLSRSGYTFGGWNTNSSGTGTNYNAGSSLTPTANTTLYARWYSTVTYSVNGGRGTTPVAQTANANSSITLPSGIGFSRDGYIFGGWNTLADGTGTNYNAGSSYAPAGNITLYAKWSGYTITFDANGGAGTTTQTVSVGSSIILPESGLSRSGYTFGGWNTLANGTGTDYSAGAEYTPTGLTTLITLYARWYSVVTFNINSGTGTAPAAQTVLFGSSITLPSGSGLSRSNYDFGGWNTLANGTGTNYSAGASYTPTGNITLYARWHPIYTIIFDLNGGTGTKPANQMKSAVNSVSLPSGDNISKVGYKFGGWNTDANGTGTNYLSSPFYPTASMTLYARWYTGSTLLLTANVWAHSNTGATAEYVGPGTIFNYNEWYSFPVTSGTTYYIWWNDKYGGGGGKTGSVAVGARYAGLSSWIFGGTNNEVFLGWTTPQSFVADRNGTVEIRVIPYNSSYDDSGSYAIVYSTSSTRPAQ